MKYLKLVVVAIASIAMMTVAAATANGAPVSSAPTHLTKASADGTHITSVLTNATFASGQNSLTVRDRQGRTVQHVPLSVALNGVQIPLRANVSADRTTATLTPVLSAQSRALIARGLHPASAKKDRAYSSMMYHLNRGWANGGGLFTAVGALIGLVVGCIVIVGCIWGAGVGAVIGAAVGINQGDPQAGQSVLNWINTP